MSEISLALPPHANDRAPAQTVSAGHPLPGGLIAGTVEINLVAKPADGTLALEMSDKTGTNLVGTNAAGDSYLRVEKDKSYEVKLVLAGNWKWKFLAGSAGFSLASSAHAARYWLTGSPNDKTRTIVIKSSGQTPVSAAADTGQFDEKFNLTVEILQNGTARPLIIEIDPITKNPPPVDGLAAPDGVADPIA